MLHVQACSDNGLSAGCQLGVVVPRLQQVIMDGAPMPSLELCPAWCAHALS